MRWATPISFFALFTRQQQQQSQSSQLYHYYYHSHSSSLSRELSLSDQILSLLNSLPSASLEPSLDVLSPLLTPHVISAVLSHPLPFPSAFRLFVWASAHRRLRSFHSLNLLASSILSDPLNNFPSSWLSLSQINSLGRPISSLPFVALIRAHRASGDTEGALDAFARMPDFSCKPDTFAYNTVLDILVKKDPIFIAMALALYYRMLKLNCHPNRATFGILIDGLCQAGLIDDARNLFDEMVHLGIAPNAMIHTLILSGLCSKGKLGEAEKLLNSMRKNNVRPDSVAYSVVLSGYCRLGRIDEAFERLRAFQEEGFVIGLSGYSSLIDALFRAKRFEDACLLFEEILSERSLVEPDCVLYTIMIRGYSEAGRVDEAAGFLREMMERGVVPDTYCYNTLIKGLCDVGHLDRARSLRLEISKNNLFTDSATETIMICGLCKEGLVHEAQQIFEEMGKHGCVPTVHTFNALMSGLCKSGQIDEARSLFYKMNMKPSLFLRLSQGGNHRDNGHLCKMVEQLCEAGLVVKAYKLLRDVIDVVPDVVTYNVLIDGLFKVRKPDEALKHYKELHIMGHRPDEVTHGIVIDGLSKVHMEESAWMLYENMLRDGRSPTPETCNTLMRMLCRKRRVSQAIALWLTHITRWRISPDEAETLKEMKDHFKQGRLEETVKGLIEMDRKGGSVNSSPYTIWLIGFCQARQVDVAFKIFTILTEVDIELTPPSCVLLIHSLCWEGKLASALDVMLYALRKGFSLNKPVGNRLLKKLCMGNKNKEAHALVWRMSLAGYDMDLYLRAATKQLLYNQMTGVG